MARMRLAPRRPAEAGPRGENAGDGGGDTFALIAPPRHITQRENADQALFAVDDREPPHAHLRHPLGDPVEVLVVVAVLDVLAHYFTHWRVGPLALRHSANRDVAVGDHADQAVVFAHRQG